MSTSILRFPRIRRTRAALAFALAIGAGCATPQYAVRPTPTPDESQSAVQIERSISAAQAQEFDKQSARVVQSGERLFGFDIAGITQRLVRTTERANLPYRVLMYRSDDPNAAALADGRIYISTGMLNYLAGRGSRDDELAFVLAHELGHTAAQHLVQRYRQLQKQQVLMALVDIGAAVATQGRSAQAQQLGGLAKNAASLAGAAAASSYSQQQELEADQLGIRYVIRAGYDPNAALRMLEDFQRFDSGSPLLRTHPYIAVRREYLVRYLEETGGQASSAPQLSTPFAAPSAARRSTADERAQLQRVQRLYPPGSQSWKNLQRQIDELNY